MSIPSSYIADLNWPYALFFALTVAYTVSPAFVSDEADITLATESTTVEPLEEEPSPIQTHIIASHTFDFVATGAQLPCPDIVDPQDLSIVTANFVFCQE